MKKSLIQTALIALGVFVAAGCAITDYTGLAFHKTSGEAKLFGTEIAFTGFGADLDGTYSYTVKYDNTHGPGPVTINSYRNAGMVSFSRDGLVDRDGDDIQGRSGDAGGKFLPHFKSVDNNQGGCEFFSNITFDKSDNGPGIALCSGFNEEVDKDLDLQAPFASLDELFGGIWSGALRGNMSLEITGLNLNDAFVPVETFTIYAVAGPLRPGKFIVDGTQSSLAALIDAVLANTEHMAPVNLGLVFDGGLTFGLPNGSQVAFNHDVLFALTQN